MLPQPCEAELVWKSALACIRQSRIAGGLPMVDPVAIECQDLNHGLGSDAVKTGIDMTTTKCSLPPKTRNIN